MFELEKPLVESSTPAEHSSSEPVETIEGGLEAGVVLICDHAANRLPAAYQGLGLSRADLSRHIAWDIGAAEVTRHLAAKLSAPAVLSRSRACSSTPIAAWMIRRW